MFAEVVIGFEREIYLTNESSPEVVVTVLLLEGELGRRVDLTLTTVDGTALSKLLKQAPDIVILTSRIFSSRSRRLCRSPDGVDL